MALNPHDLAEFLTLIPIREVTMTKRLRQHIYQAAGLNKNPAIEMSVLDSIVGGGIKGREINYPREIIIHSVTKALTQ